MENSKTTPAVLKGHGLPNYSEITPKQINQSIPILLKRLTIEFNLLESELEKIIDQNQRLDWDRLMHPLYRITEALRWSWGTISHLNGVSNSSELRDAYSSQQPDIIRFSNRIGQSKILFKALSKLKTSSINSLDSAQLRIIETELLAMKHKGIGLNDKDQKEFNKYSERLGELSTRFSNNVLDATKEWSLLISDPNELHGIPARTLESLAESAKNLDLKEYTNTDKTTSTNGPWLLGLDMPTYISVLTFANNRNLREKIYKAYMSRASSGKTNNQEVIEEILDIREKQAEILGYNNWAELSISSKMADDVTAVDSLLEELRIPAMAAAKKEIKELTKLALKETNGEINHLAPWDINYWSERLKKEKFNLNQESLRAWFPLPQVLEGLFKLCKRLFQISFIEEEEEYPKWHDDVKLFNVLDSHNKKIASFYLDPYSRPTSKRGGAWMDECLTKEVREAEEDVLPVAYLVCNQTPPVGDKPSLMSFEEVKTLFHEFGHGLQHMLTTVKYPQAAGINNVEWDAVELPSQFMENWCLDEITLNGIARHWETKEPLPKQELEKLKSSQNFNSGLNTLRQIHFASTDLKLHSEWDKKSGITPDQFRRNIAKNTTVISPIPEDQFLCSFSHIFAGGYSAGYYSYKWAEVLSADAFNAFEEIGLNNEKEVRAKGKLFRETILGLGGSISPSEIFKLFRGRNVSTKALIKHSGFQSSK